MEEQLTTPVVQNRLSNIYLLAVSFLLVPSLAASLYRMNTLGWQHIFAFQFSNMLVFWVLALYRHRLPLLVKAVYLIISAMLFGITGLLTFGLSGYSIPMFEISIILAAVLLGLRLAIAIAVFNALCIVVIGFVVSSGYHRFTIDLGTYSYTFSSWLFTATGLLCMSTMVILIASYLFKFFTDQGIELRQRAEALKITRDKLLEEVKKRQGAEKEIKVLSGLLPICAKCHKIRDDKGYWGQMEAYIDQHSEAQFSHCLCPECIKIVYPDLGKEYSE